MTLVVDTRSKQAATHVVLIGVGDYPYLKGGAQRRRLFEHHENMGQLRSPPHSVIALANWFASHLANPDRPLGSLEVLVSGGPAAYSLPGKQKKLRLQTADIGTLEVALKAWADRCDRNPDNLAVFYFCGHGVASGQEQSLLLQDFGHDAGSPFRDALAFSQFRVGMRSRRVRNQCFFVDACRSVSETYLLQYGQNFVGMPVISSALTAVLPGTQSQVFFASELGSAAYGRDGRPSVFAEGLLAALNGMAASQDDTCACPTGSPRPCRYITWRPSPKYRCWSRVNRPRPRGRQHSVVSAMGSRWRTAPVDHFPPGARRWLRTATTSAPPSRRGHASSLTASRRCDSSCRLPPGSPFKRRRCAAHDDARHSGQ
jgi:hypothetical protein